MKNILEKIRIEKGFNKKEMSEILEISDSFYNRIETGKKPISKKLLDKIITSFNLTDEEIKELKQQQILIRTPIFLSDEVVEIKKEKTKNKEVGEILKKFRKNNKLTGAMLAKIFNCSSQFIFKLETNQKTLPPEKIEILKNMMTDEEYLELIQAVIHERTKDIPGQLEILNKDYFLELETIGEILKKFRKNNKITGAKLAEILGCSQQYISQIEKGDKPIPSEKMEILKKIMSELEYSNLVHSINFSKMKNITDELIIIFRKK